MKSDIPVQEPLSSKSDPFKDLSAAVRRELASKPLREQLAFMAGRRRGQFAVQYHTSTKGKRLDLQRFHYLAKPYADISPDITLVCGVQSGKTEWFVVDGLALISFGASYQMVQPKDDIVALFTRTRIMEPLARSDYYSKHCKSMHLNRLFGWNCGTGETGKLRVVFSNRADEMISFPADIVGVDERDKCDLNNLALLQDRSLGSEYALTRDSSTPTTVGNESVQTIWWMYQQTDQQKYYITCKSCGTSQALDWLQNFVEEIRDENGKLLQYRLRDEGWKHDGSRDIMPICRSCGGGLDRLAPGEWHPSERLPNYIHKRGYHWNKFSSPIVRIAEQCWLKYLEAVNSPNLLQRFYNSVCGLPYQGSGTKITEDMLNLCVRDYYMDVEKDTCEGPCSMGVDVGPRWLDVRISSYPYRDKRIRRSEYIGKVKSVEELPPLIERFNVQTVVVDAEPETREILRFKESARCAVYICYTKCKRGMILADLLLDKVKEERKLTIDRTVMMDEVLSTYARREVMLPKNIRFLSEKNYVAEMTNPTRVLEVDDSSGREVYVWTHGSDHSFLADVYDYCAMLLGNFSGSGYGVMSSPRPPVMMIDPMDDLDIYGSMA